jgi:general secretion pathway protein D
LQEKQILVAADSTENHRLFDRMGLRTFYVPDAAATAQQLQDLVNVLRTVFEIKYVSSNAQKSTITVRASQNVLNAATIFLERLGSSAPEVMLDVKIYEVSHTLMRAFGMQIPYQFNLFNIPAIAQQFTLAGGQSIQDLINQLIASGGINQANSSALQALLAQLGQGGTSILNQSFVTFGNGLTLFGVSVGQLTATLSQNESQLRSLQHVTLRAAQGKDASVNLGSRYPIVNASFAPIFNTPAISQAIANNSFVAPVPSFSYEDLGINMKIKPVVHGTSDVSLTFELKVRSLTGASANGVPVIGNREYTGSINVMNEQSAVVAGQITSTEQKSLSGLPGIGQIPVLSHTLASNNIQKDDNELLILVTPHIIRMAENESSEIWMTGIK